MCMNILNIAEIVGIASFALSGFLIAVRKKLDLLGVILFSFLTALGGGIIKDVIIGNTPVSLKNSQPSLIVISVIVLAYFSKISQKEQIDRYKIFILSDAIGLVAFSINGAMVGIENELNFFGVIILSLSTAIGGGITRDILINEVPIVLTSGFYATISIIVSVAILFLKMLNCLNDINIVLIFIIALFLRLFAYYKKWNLPSL